jgi:hypothetical protein
MSRTPSQSHYYAKAISDYCKHLETREFVLEREQEIEADYDKDLQAYKDIDISEGDNK